MAEYKLGGRIYNSKKRYTLKDWGKILQLFQNINPEDPVSGVIVLLTGNKLDEMLELILSDYIATELYEEDFEVVNQIIMDFFSRKNGLINSGKSVSPELTKNLNTTPIN